MVQVSIFVRPTPGYHYPNKIDRIEIDSSARLESIQEKYTTTGTTTRLYHVGHELPLNSSVGSHNFDEGAILECCRSPGLSAALSAVLKDLDEIKKLPEEERTRDELMGILQLPATIREDANNEIWKTTSWSDDGLKTRVINFAIIKSVIQRKDRYQTYDLPHCNTCQSLYNALQLHNVWKGGRENSRRGFQQHAHIFKPEKRDGNPTTNWMLLDEKLKIQQRIKTNFSSVTSPGYDSPPVDYLEEFVRQDSARHGTGQTNTPRRRSNITTNDASDSHLEYLASTPPRSRTSTPRPRQSGGSTSAASRMQASSACSRNKQYIPQYASGPYSVLATLHLAMHSKHKQSNGRRLLTLSEDQLKRMAQPMCRSNLYDKGRIRGRNAFACMDGLIEKQLVRKEIVRNTDINHHAGTEIEKWGLLEKGEVLGELCAEFDRAVNQVIPVQQISDKLPGRARTELTLCLDSREDVHLLRRMKHCCEDEHVIYVEKELPAGDYLFVQDPSSGEDDVVPLVIERKSWSDLADSCLDRGRSRNRLDCVKLGSVSNECSGNCQLCKMKRCGCSQIMFIIEGERCLSSDSLHRSAKKCTQENPCSVCRLLKERHNMTQDVLEGVLHRLQVEHGCYIHYTNSYNDTIQSLFDMKQILELKQPNSETCLPYDLYASNARRSDSGMFNQSKQPKPTSIQELNIEVMLPSIVNLKWRSNTIRNLLEVTGRESALSSNSQSKQRKRHTTSNDTIDLDDDDDIIELKGSTDAGDPICINLEDDFGHSPMSGNSRPKKRQKTDAICLDSDSDSESAKPQNIRGGGSSDEGIETLAQVGTKSNHPDSSNNLESSDSDSDSMLFSNLSRFDQSRRNNFLDKSPEDESSVSDAEWLSSEMKKKKKKKSSKRKTPPTSPKKSQRSSAKRSPKPANVDVSKKHPHDMCLLLSSDNETGQAQPMATRKQPPHCLKTGEQSSSKPASQRIRQGTKRKARDSFNLSNETDNQLEYPLLVFHGCDEYDQQFMKRLNSMWKDTSSTATDNNRPANDLSTASLNGKVKENPLDFVRRRLIMRFFLWMQVNEGIQIRSVRRTRFAEELKRSIEGKSTSTYQSSATMHRTQSSSTANSANLLASNSRMSTPATAQNLILSKHQNPTIDRSATSNRSCGLVREARLKRFDKASDYSASSVAGSTSQPSKWSCPRCTLENFSTDSICSACGGDSPAKRLAPAPARSIIAEKWACSSCTYHNNAQTHHCSVCGGPKQSLSTMASSSQYTESYASPIMSSSSITSSKNTASRRPVRCGACGQEGHNRSNANEHNCVAYFDEKEISRREKIREKRKNIIAEENEKISAIEQESENAERMQAELARQIKELEKNKERAESFRKEELKRRKQKVKRLQKQQSKHQG